MKTLRMLACCAFAAATLSTGTSLATSWTTSGFVYCDANSNGQIDSSTDTPLTGVLVVVTNISGTYSNAVFTVTPEGGFIMQLPNMPDTYVEYLHPLTLPADATPVIPANGIYTFTLNNASNFEGSFLVSSSFCGSTNTPPPPPPPPPQTNGCDLKACGSILFCKKPQYVFGGQVIPACLSSNGDTGTFDIVAVCARLHFQGSVLEIINCGEFTEGNCRRKFIEFQGAGTLKGINGCGANYGSVYFVARAEDGGEACGCPDRLYFRVYTSDGTTLLLISGDLTHPDNVVPVIVSTGGLVINTSACSSGNCGGGNHGGDQGHQGGGDDHKGDKCDKCDQCGHGDKCDKCDHCLHGGPGQCPHHGGGDDHKGGDCNKPGDNKGGGDSNKPGDNKGGDCNKPGDNKGGSDHKGGDKGGKGDNKGGDCNNGSADKGGKKPGKGK